MSHLELILPSKQPFMPRASITPASHAFQLRAATRVTDFEPLTRSLPHPASSSSCHRPLCRNGTSLICTSMPV